MRNIVITFGVICLCSLVLFQMGKVAYIKNSLPVELLIGIFAAIFLFVGVYISRRQAHTRSGPPVSPQVDAPVPNNGIDHNKISELGISKREYEILGEIALGLSNSEIAEKIFVSESTVKTHISNLLLKLNARRRTEAVRIAKELKIIN